jgi:hypothetical protein
LNHQYRPVAGVSRQRHLDLVMQLDEVQYFLVDFSQIDQVYDVTGDIQPLMVMRIEQPNVMVLQFHKMNQEILGYRTKDVLFGLSMFSKHHRLQLYRLIEALIESKLGISDSILTFE